MWRTFLSKLRFLLVPLLVLSWVSGWASLSAAAAFSPATPQQGTSRLDSALVDSDFDHDYIPDLAISRRKELGYEVEIQFSTRQERASLTSVSNENKVGLFALDADRDNDQDLAIVSASSLQLLTVWLNDGHGHFERTDRWPYANSFMSGSPCGYDHSSTQADRVFLSPNGRLPLLDGSILASAGLETQGFIPTDFQELPLPILIYRFVARSPPPNSTL